MTLGMRRCSSALTACPDIRIIGISGLSCFMPSASSSPDIKGIRRSVNTRGGFSREGSSSRALWGELYTVVGRPSVFIVNSRARSTPSLSSTIATVV